MSEKDSTSENVRYLPVPGFPGYRVGDDGSVWGNQRGKNGSWKLLKGGTDKDGYRRVTLCCSGARKNVRIATLILEIFVSPRPLGLLACHNDNDTKNNAVTNLRWDTQKSNMADKKRHGTSQIGERHGCCKLSEKSVVEIRQRAASGETYKSIGDRFGVDASCVYHVVNRKTWKHIL